MLLRTPKPLAPCGGKKSSEVGLSEGESYHCPAAGVYHSLFNPFNMNPDKNRVPKGGRRPKENPMKHRYVFRLDDEDNARFLAMFDQSGKQTKAEFITAVLFAREIKVVRIDKAAADYYMRLTTFHSQFRAIGVNYNQLVKALNANFTEKKALAFLYKLEKQTAELAELSRRIIALTAEFETKHLHG